MAQNIICSSWEGTKDPWLCLVTKLLLFGLLCLLLHFLTSLVKLILWLKCFFFFFPTDKSQVEDMGWGRQGPQGPASFYFHFTFVSSPLDLCFLKFPSPPCPLGSSLWKWQGCLHLVCTSQQFYIMVHWQLLGTEINKLGDSGHVRPWDLKAISNSAHR